MRPTTQVTGKENDMIKARIDGVELKISEREPLLAGTVGLNKISLSFSDEWAIFTKQIDFTNEQSGETRRISAEVGVCTVPWELLKAEGDITCYVRGIGSDGRLVLRTNEANLGTVLGSTDGNVPGTGTPTPDVCDETAAKIGDLSKLETNDKSQLVAAINELKRAEGLGVFEVTLTAQDGVLTADKTFEQVKAAVADGKPVLKVHSDGDVLWFFLLDKSSAEIDFVGFADEQIRLRHHEHRRTAAQLPRSLGGQEQQSGAGVCKKQRSYLPAPARKRHQKLRCLYHGLLVCLI